MTCHFSIRDVTFHASTTGVRIIATTDVACHLWCRLTTHPPRFHKKPSYRRGIWLVNDVRFCFTVFEDNEQYEAGDTLTHTWWKEDWPVCTTKYLYLWGKIAGEACPSTSPLLQYHNDGVDPIPPPPPPEEEWFERYVGVCPGAWTVRLGFWNAQTFTPQVSHDLTRVSLRLYRSGSDPTEIFYCQIHNTVAGKPAGAFLGQTSCPLDDLTLQPGESWIHLYFDPLIPLTAGVMYAIVAWTSNNVSPYAYWRYRPTDNEYPRGTQCYSYDGSTWTIQADADHRFYDWGYRT